MNAYQKIINYFFGINIRINSDLAKNNAFGNLLINKFEEIHEKIEMYERLDLTLDIKLYEKKLTMENMQNYKNNTIKIEEKPSLGIQVINISNSLFNSNKVDIRFNGQPALTQAFEDYNTSYLLSFAIIKQLDLTINKKDLKELSKDKEKLFNSIILHKTLEKADKYTFENPIKDLVKQQNSLENDIKNIQLTINSIKERLKKKEQSALHKDIKSKAKQIANFITGHHSINEDSIYIVKENNDTHTIKFETNELEIYKLNRSYLRKTIDNIFPAYTKFREHLQDILDEKVKIVTGRYRIQLKLEPNSYTIQYFHLDSPYRNPHEAISCLGAYSNPLEQAQNNGDIIAGITILLEYLQSINLGDPGSYELPKRCKLIKDDKVIYDGGLYR